jgi:hypothetical protein
MLLDAAGRTYQYPEFGTNHNHLTLFDTNTGSDYHPPVNLTFFTDEGQQRIMSQPSELPMTSNPPPCVALPHLEEKGPCSQSQCSSPSAPWHDLPAAVKDSILWELAEANGYRHVALQVSAAFRRLFLAHALTVRLDLRRLAEQPPRWPSGIPQHPGARHTARAGVDWQALLALAAAHRGPFHFQLVNPCGSQVRRLAVMCCMGTGQILGI